MSAFPQIAMYGHYIQKWSIQFSLLLLIFVFSECCLKLIFVELHVTIMILYWNSFLLKCQITRGVTIRRATIRYVSRYVGRDTTNDTISDDTPTNLESQTHFS